MYARTLIAGGNQRLVETRFGSPPPHAAGPRMALRPTRTGEEGYAMRYRLGGIETLHHGFSGPAVPPRRERLLRPWRARAERHDGAETLVRLGATADEVRRRWEQALEDCGPEDLRQISEVWLGPLRKGCEASASKPNGSGTGIGTASSTGFSGMSTGIPKESDNQYT